MSSQAPDLHQATIDAILSYAGPATLPFQRAHARGPYGTMFWFNELLESTGDTDTVRQLLVTASEPARRVELAEVTIRPELCDPAPSAQKLLIRDFAGGWTHLDGLGVAVQPTAGLHAYAARKGWTWAADGIRDGLTARADDLSLITGTPVTAYALAHDVTGEDEDRDQAILVGSLARAADGSVRWSARLPEGCVGAPVFYSAPQDEDSFKLLCAGVLLPADDHGFGHHPVVTLDRILGALADSGPAERPRRRRWWRRRSG
ncbi:hypothetical protein AB0N17_08680 [Streptomyces sp. NPDC051133]|uniref:hypothetical protein n=1 Tax=Streptomyces sp. NPDC051133 TaxID=3155521 RepID=UPI003436D421